VKIPSRGQHSVLLASASSGGTIAAVRNLGRNGVGAQVLSSTRLDAAAWSRHTSRTYSTPAEIDHELFFDRIMAIGKANPGLVLLPTSDQTAWIYTANADALAQYFLMYQPSLESIRRILDKKLLTDAAIQAGLDVLPSWDPETSDELWKLVATFPYPMLIKPRTHVQRLRNDKGVVVDQMSFRSSMRIFLFASGIEALRQRNPSIFRGRFYNNSRWMAAKTSSQSPDLSIGRASYSSAGAQ
jgi:D-aspartate ligase